MSVMITVAARIRAGVMQLRHWRAEQRLGLRLNRLVEPGIQRSGELASYDNRRIKLNSRVAAKSFQEDRRGRAAKSLLDRSERLVIELDRGKRLSAFGLGCSDLCIAPRYSRKLTRSWRRFRRRRTGGAQDFAQAEAVDRHGPWLAGPPCEVVVLRWLVPSMVRFQPWCLPCDS